MTIPNVKLRLVAFHIVGVIVIVAGQAWADCQSDRDNGWALGKICASWFDSNGHYVDSRCQQDQYDDPFADHHTECKVGIDPGTCTGSNCTGTAGCTVHGFCEDDFDCCGLNWCDYDRHRCQDGGIGPPEN
jgi:hypothetical protein